MIQALDFVGQLITFDPAQRPTAEQALTHPWLATYHDESDEPTCPRVFDRWRQIEQLETLDQYRDALAKEVRDCRREVRNMAALSPEVEGRIPAAIQEEVDLPAASSERGSPQVLARSLSPEERFSRRVSRKASLEPGATQPTIPESAVTFPGTGDPVVAYSRRSMFGQPSRTNSTYSIHRATNSEVVEGQGSSTISFPTATEYVMAGRHRTASLYTSGGDGGSDVGADVRRLLRTLSTVSIYESGEGLAGGLADVAPIGKYIVQKDRTGDEALPSEMPREIRGEENTESPSVHEDKDGSGGKRRFQVG